MQRKQFALSFSNSSFISALSTGMRKGEILSLKWDDIDFDRGAILLQATKNGERRVIPLVGLSLESLKKTKSSSQTTLVFPSLKNPNISINIRSAWKKHF